MLCHITLYHIIIILTRPDAAALSQPGARQRGQSGSRAGHAGSQLGQTNGSNDNLDHHNDITM